MLLLELLPCLAPLLLLLLLLPLCASSSLRGIEYMEAAASPCGDAGAGLGVGGRSVGDDVLDVEPDAPILARSSRKTPFHRIIPTHTAEFTHTSTPLSPHSCARSGRAHLITDGVAALALARAHPLPTTCRVVAMAGRAVHIP